MKEKQKLIETFDLKPGRILSSKYEIVTFLGSGWEGEVYKVRELATGIERAIKLFFPHRNIANRATKFYAKKLHKLRQCSILIQYHTQESFIYRKNPIIFLVSEFVEGELLSDFQNKQKGKRLQPFESLHILYSLASGVEEIHKSREYHGDLHDDNVIIRRVGVKFRVKLVDMYNWGPPSAENIRDDVCNLIRVFYDSIGGSKFYPKQPKYVKNICCGLKRFLIIKKFRTAGHLRQYLETFDWD